MNSLTRLLTTLFIFVFVTACGGGSSGDGETTPETTTETTTILDNKWSAPQRIEFSSKGLSPQLGSPKIQFDNNGNAISVWVQPDSNDAWSVYANHYNATSGWATPELLENSFSQARNPTLAVFDNGNAIAVWIQASTSPTYNILASHYTLETGWGTPVTIMANGYNGSMPIVKVDSTGNAFVWSVIDQTNRLLGFTEYKTSLGWSGQTEILASKIDSLDADIDKNGNMIVIYGKTVSLGGGNTIYQQWSSLKQISSSSWSSGKRLDNNTEVVDIGTCGGRLPHVKFDSMGNAIAAYEICIPLGGNSSWVSTYKKSSGWDTSSLLSKDVNGANSANIAFDTSGNAMLVWKQSDAVKNNLLSKYYNVVTGWESVKFVAGAINETHGGYVVMDSQGNATAFYIETNSLLYTLSSSNYTKGVGWGQREVVRAAGNQSYVRGLAIDNKDNVVAIWTERITSTSLDYDLWSNTFK